MYVCMRVLETEYVCVYMYMCMHNTRIYVCLYAGADDRDVLLRNKPTDVHTYIHTYVHTYRDVRAEEDKQANRRAEALAAKQILKEQMAEQDEAKAAAYAMFIQEKVCVCVCVCVSFWGIYGEEG
jgi:hypothetical protein